MNKVFRVIWNASTQSWVAVSELARGRVKSSSNVSADLVKVGVALSLGTFALTPLLAEAASAISAQTSANIHIETEDGNTRNNILIGKNATHGQASQLDQLIQKWAFGEGSRNKPSPDTRGTNNIVIGNGIASGDRGIVLGDGARTWALSGAGNHQIAIGSNSFSAGNYTVAIGMNAQSGAQGAVSLGGNALAVRSDSLALGSGAVAQQSESTAIGAGSNATRAKSVAIGSGSNTVEAATQEGNINVGGVVYDRATGENNDVSMLVSFGSAGNERQLKHVAPGKISATSTDAINGSQLFQITKGLQEKPITFTGTSGSTTRKLGDTLQIMGGGATSGAYSSRNVKTEASAGKIEIKLADNPTFTTLEIDNGATIGGKLEVAGKVQANGGLTVAASQIVNMSGNKIQHVANGTGTNDAVNVRQLDSVRKNTIKLDADSTSTPTQMFGQEGGVSFGVKGAGGITSTASGSNITLDLTQDTKNKINNAATKDLDNLTVSGNNVIKNQAKEAIGVEGEGLAQVTPNNSGDKKIYTVKVDTQGVKNLAKNAVDITSSDITVTTPSNTNDTKTFNLALQKSNVVTENEDKVVTSGAVHTAINEAGWNLKANSQTDGRKIINGNDVIFQEGMNLNVTREDNKIIIKTVDSPTFTNLETTGTATLNGLTLKPNAAVNIGNNKIQNVQAGDADTDAVNVSQLRAVRDNTLKLSGDNNTKTNGQALNKANGLEFGVKGQANYIETTASGSDVTLKLADVVKNKLDNLADNPNDTYANRSLSNINEAGIKKIQDQVAIQNGINTIATTDTIDGVKTFKVDVDTTKTVLAYKAENEAVKTTTLSDGLTFKNTDGLTIATENNGVVKFGLDSDTKAKLKIREEVAAGEGVTVTPSDNTTGGKTFTVAVNNAHIKRQAKEAVNVTSATPADLTVEKVPTDQLDTYNISLKKSTTVAADDNQVVTSDAVHKAIVASGWKLKANDEAGNGQKIANDQEAIFNEGKNLNITRENNKIIVKTIDDVSFTTVTTSGDVKVGGNANITGLANVTGMLNAKGGLTVLSGQTVDMGDNKVTNVANGTADKDAVNLSQLNATTEVLTEKGLSFNGNDGLTSTKRKLGEVLNISGDATTAGNYSGKNVKTVISDGKVAIQIADNPVFNHINAASLTTTGAITSGGMMTAKNGLTVETGGVNILNGNTIQMGNNRVQGVAAAEDNSDAVNLGQLNNLVNNSGFNIERQWTGETQPTLINRANNNHNVTFKDGFLTTTSVNPLGADRTEVKFNVVLQDIDNDPITGVAKPNATTNTVGVAEGSTTASVVSGAINRAVAKSGFFLGVNEEEKATSEKVNKDELVLFKQGDNILVSREGKNVTIKTVQDPVFNSLTTNNTATIGGVLNANGGLTVASGKNVDMGNNQIHNVADGTADKDAVNLSQLNATKETLNNSINTLGSNNIKLTGNTGETEPQALDKAGGLSFGVQGEGMITSKAEGSNVIFDLTKAAKDEIAIRETVVQGEGVIVSEGENSTKGKAFTVAVNNDHIKKQAKQAVEVVSGTDDDLTVEKTPVSETKDKYTVSLQKSNTVVAGDNKVVTSDAVNRAINASGWTVKVNDEANGERINNNGEVKFIQGDNILISRENNQITVKTVQNPTFTGGATIGGMLNANGGLTVANGQNVDMGNNPIHNVANGVEDNDAVNMSQLNALNRQTQTYFHVNSTVRENYGVPNAVAQATGENAVAAGPNAFASHPSSIALGHNVYATEEKAVSIGHNALARHSNSVALGADATTNDVDATQEYFVKDDNGQSGVISAFAGIPKQSSGAVAVGQQWKERQIQHVAAGRVAAGSTDAVNGSQLFHIANNTGFNIKENNVDKSRINNNGAVNFANGTHTVASVTDAYNAAQVVFDVKTINMEMDKESRGAVQPVQNQDALVTATNVADTINRSGWIVTASAANGGELVGERGAALVTPGNQVEFKAGKNLKVRQYDRQITYSTNDNVDFSQVNVSQRIRIENGPSMSTEGINAGGSKITNVARGVKDTDAVNVSQLRAVGNNDIQLIGNTGATDKQAFNKREGLAFTIKGKGMIESNAEGSSVTFDLSEATKKLINTRETVIAGSGLDLVKGKNATEGEEFTLSLNHSVVKGLVDIENGQNTVASSREDNGRKILKVDVDLTDYATKQDLPDAVLTYKANGNGVKNTSLQQGLDFTNTNGLTIETADNGVVNIGLDEVTRTKLDIRETVKAGAGVAVTFDDNNSTGGKEFVVSVDNDHIKAQAKDAVEVVSGTPADLTVVTTSTDTNETHTLTLNKADAVTEGDKKVVTSDAVSKAIKTATNNSGWTVKANSEASGERINNNGEVNFIQGNNIEISRTGSNITVKTVATPTFDTVTANKGLTVKKGGTVNMGNNRIQGVADATDDADAVNFKQLKATNTAVSNLGNNNIKLTGNSGETDVQALNKDGGLSFGVKGDETYITSKATGSDVVLDLTQSAKAKLDNAANQSLSNINPAGKTVIQDAAKEAVDIEDGLNTKASSTDKNGVKTFKVDIDLSAYTKTSDLGNTANLTYKANGENAKQTSLNNGLNFTNSNGLSIEAKENGEVALGLNQATQDAIKVRETVVQGEGVKVAESQNSTGGKEYTVSVNNEHIKAQAKDAVEVVSGTPADLTVTTNSTNTKETHTLTLNKADAVTEGDKKVVTSDAVSKAIKTATNNAGWTVKANSEASGERINNNGEVNFIQGDNIEISRTGSNITVKTVATPTFDTVTANKGLTVKNGATVNMGNNQIKNVADATEDGDAVNFKQFNQLGANEFSLRANSGKTDAQSLNQDGGLSFGVKGDETYITSKAAGSDVTLDLTQSAKDKLDNAANQSLSNINASGRTLIQNTAKDVVDIEDGLNTKASSADKNGVKTFKVDVDLSAYTKTSDLGNTANLSYKANGENAKQTSLNNGLNFTNSNGLSIEAKENGEVAFGLSQATQDAIKVRETVVQGEGVKVTESQNSTGGKEYTVSVNNDHIKAQAKDAVDVVSGTPADLTVTTNSTNTKETHTLTLNKADAVTEGDKKVVTSDAVSKAIKNSAWNLTNGAVDGGVDETELDEAEQINPNDQLKLQAGKNLKVKREANGTVTYATQDNVTFASVGTNNLSVSGSATFNGATVFNNGFTVAQNQIIDMGGNRVQNVADASDETDAVNYKQLKALSSALTKAGLKFTGNEGSTDRELGQTLSIEGKAKASGSYSSDNVKTVVTNGKVEIQIADNPDFGDVNAKRITAENAVLGGNGKQVDVREGTTVNMNGNRIQNVGDAKADGDAVNLKQLKATNAEVAKGWNVTTTASVGGKVTNSSLEQINMGETVTLDAGKNIHITQAGNTLSIATTDKPTFEQITAEKGLRVAEGATVDLGNNVIDGIADGNIAPGSKQAVNAGQLYKVQQTANAGWGLTANGQNRSDVKPTETVDLNNTDGNIQITKTADSDNVTFNLSNNIDLGEKGSLKVGRVGLKADGIDVGGGKLTNVSAGDVNENSTDAVNGSQLNALQTFVNKGWELDTGVVQGSTGKVNKAKSAKPAKVGLGESVSVNAGNNIVVSQNGKSIDIATTMTPTFDSLKINKGGVVDMGGNRIQNVGNAVKPTDAVNYGQFKSELGKVDGRLRSGIAGAVASASLVQAFNPRESIFAVGGGTYRGKSAVALGYSKVSDNGRIILKVTGSANSSGDYTGGASVGFKF